MFRGIGEANERGFVIVDTKRYITLQTEHYSDGKIKGKTVVSTYDLRLVYGGMFFWGLITGLLLRHFIGPLPLIQSVSIIAFSNLIFCLSITRGPIYYHDLIFVLQTLRNKELLEWHGCEHKVVILLRCGLDPTIENLRQISRIQPGCGFVKLWPNITQRFFTTREPDSCKLEAGLRLAREYYKITKGSVK
ncbi:MAG: DUF1385 domain-containing protein [Candidatus Nealsonbacteria bacterium]